LVRALVGENHVELSTVLLNYFVQLIEVTQVRDIAWDSRRRLTNFGDRSVEDVLATARDEYMIHPFQYEALCCARPIPVEPPVITPTLPASLLELSRNPVVALRNCSVVARLSRKCLTEASGEPNRLWGLSGSGDCALLVQSGIIATTASSIFFTSRPGSPEGETMTFSFSKLSRIKSSDAAMCSMTCAAHH